MGVKKKDVTSDRPDRLSDEDVAFYAQDSTIYRSTTPPVRTALELLAREVQSSRARVTDLEAELKARDPEGEAFMLRLKLARIQARLDACVLEPLDYRIVSTPAGVMHTPGDLLDYLRGSS